ncbi:N-acetylglucosamine kinase [Ammoniphilus sp. CFH 90114]|uniref:N-acetylglucosamine kinase n=1 Tax=Ammoniphilus sp. CFH 90114 TaxID=2493665 RepID=UPI0013E91F58|nr:BadF/BadG/BcrA/BcrD ATPase family protein [Ammoniphilus sp. CFH 90114]
MPLNKQWFIGVDGGGTSTRGVLSDREGQIRAVVRGDSSNMNSRPLPEVIHTLKKVCQDLLDQVGGTSEQVQSVFLGLAGAGRPRERDLLLEGLQEAYPGRVQVDNDAVTALYAGTWGRPGMVLIAGTGSIAYGVSTTGERYRVGGWGWLLGDEGSGFILGQEALRAILRAFDGRGKETQLTSLVFSLYGIQEATEVVSFIHASENPRKLMAEVGPLVLQAAEQGDEVALEIVQQAAQDLVELVVACSRVMVESLPIVLAGGLLGEGTLLREKVMNQLSDLGYSVEKPSFPPSVGALIMALQTGGVTLDRAVKQNMTESWALLGEGVQS